jgi:hypothetical protein
MTGNQYYYVFVPKGEQQSRQPSKLHETYDAAIAEAKRLVEQKGEFEAVVCKAVDVFVRTSARTILTKRECDV